MKMISTSETARILRVCEGTVRNLDKRGILKSLRDHRQSRKFYFSDVQGLKEKRSKLISENGGQEQ